MCETGLFILAVFIKTQAKSVHYSLFRFVKVLAVFYKVALEVSWF